MIVAVVAGLVWFVVAGRTDSAVPAPQPTLAVPASASPTLESTPGDAPTPTVSTAPSDSPPSSASPTPSPSPTPSTTEPDGGSTFSKPLTQKGLPTGDDLAASDQDWSAQDSYEGPGEAPSLCLAQDLTTLAGLRKIYRRDYTLEGEGYGTALVFDFDDADAAETVAGTLVKDAADCKAPLTKAGFLADSPVGPTDADIPEGIWGQTVDLTYRQGEEQPVTREGIGVARASNRVVFLSLVIQVGENKESNEDDGARQDLAQALTRAAERLTK